MSEDETAGRAPQPLPTPPPDYDPLKEESLTALPALLGMRLTEWREGFAVVLWRVGPEARNRQGVAHGGATATLLDTACGYAPIFCPYPGRYRRVFTLNLDLQYLAPVRLESGEVRAEARVTGGGKSIVFVEGLARDEGGALLARAQGVFSLARDSRSPWGEPREKQP